MASGESVHIRVLVASTGVCYNISLHPTELTVANIRRHLAAAVPPQDQILLLGPPYKVPRDATLQSEEVLTSLRLGDLEDNPVLEEEDGSANRSILSTTERTGARRLFLFSKQALSESAPDPPPCQLQPMTLNLPTEPGPSPLKTLMDPSGGSATQPSPVTSPLHQALEVYERRFMLHLCRGRALADGADMRLSACRTCVAEQAVMARALRAAVSNLSDHFNGATRTRSEFTTTFQATTASHAALLQRFDSLLGSLATIPLHPALVSVARASGRVMETLLDTVPVEREKTWATQCSTSHQRLMTLFSELEEAFGRLGTTSSRAEEAKQDASSEEEVKVLWSEVEGVGKRTRDKQAKRLEKLTSDHGDVVKVVMNAISSEGGNAQDAFSKLEEMSKASTDILPSMEADDMILMQLMQKVSDSKTRAMKRMKIRLREVSVSQSAIQRALSSLTVLREALSQQTENMVHLEHVAELPRSYTDFLAELRRRRAYGAAVTSSSTAMMDRLASMRNDEVKAREKFLRGSGRHLMPPFFEMFAPTLATPPPLFTPQLPAMIELETLPDVGPAEPARATMAEAPADSAIQGNVSGNLPAGGVSTTSSLTTESQPPQQSMEKVASSAGDEPEAMVTTTATTGTARMEVTGIKQPQEQLIVSADEHSANDDLIMGPSGNEDAAAEAERKTLAYENAVLRQALERMGGKSPRTYIAEAREKDQQDEAESASAIEIASLTKQLEEAKAQTRAANEELIASKKDTDKISYSSFSIGDVGLFMPTGRGTGGKRSYLAFHIGCPHRYLSTDSIEGTPDYVIGRIVYQEALVAGEAGTDANPYRLPEGTKFWVLTVELIHPKVKKSIN